MREWLARTYLIAGALAVAAAVVSGLVLERELWTPELTGTAQGYNTALIAHGLPALGAAALAGLGYRVVADLRVPVAGWLGVALWLFAIAVAASMFVAPPSPWVPAVDWRILAIRLGSGASGLISALHVGTAPRARGSVIAFAIAIGLASAGAMAGFGLGLFVVIAATLLAIAVLEGGTAAVGVYVAGVALAAVGYALVGGLLEVVSFDLYVHDTYVIVGVEHLRAAAIVLAMLAVVSQRAPRPRLALAGALVTTTGFVALAATMIHTGSLGMPRRYVQYMLEMQTAHQLTAIAGVALAVGLVVAAVALLPRGRASTASPG